MVDPHTSSKWHRIEDIFMTWLTYITSGRVVGEGYTGNGSGRELEGGGHGGRVRVTD